MDCRVKYIEDAWSLSSGRALRGPVGAFARQWQQEPAEPQLVQAKATLSSDFGPNFSEERATMRPPRAR
jgi:hypothetical protein